MPAYDFICTSCGKTSTHYQVPYEDREKPRKCDCGGLAEYQFPLEAVKGINVFEAFYAEPFDCDVHSRGEWKHILKDNGLEEAGDKVGGARNYDEKANGMRPVDPKGKQYVPKRIREQRAPQPLANPHEPYTPSGKTKRQLKREAFEQARKQVGV